MSCLKAPFKTFFDTDRQPGNYTVKVSPFQDYLSPEYRQFNSHYVIMDNLLLLLCSYCTKN